MDWRVHPFEYDGRRDGRISGESVAERPSDGNSLGERFRFCPCRRDIFVDRRRGIRNRFSCGARGAGLAPELWVQHVFVSLVIDAEGQWKVL